MQDELIHAIRNGDGARVAALLDADPSLLTARAGNVSAPLLAIYHQHPEIAQLFIERGAELTFAEACAAGDEARALALLDADPSLLERRSDDGFPPLGFAIFFRHPSLARTLVERGANVNAAAENAQRVAPVHAAAAVRDVETMRLLLDRGADPNARQQLGFTPLLEAANNGDLDMGKLLVARGADRHAKSDDGRDAAAIAAERGHGEFVAWLNGF
ncbi:MAG TPA: ankyrin repeat domain-containing protein [Thermoanaerobaculia bacterium]